MRPLDAAFDEGDLNSFVDGRLEPSRAAALAESLAADPEGRARVDGWTRQNDNLRTLFASVLFEPIPVRLIPSGPSARAPSPAVKQRQAGAVPQRHVGALVTAALGVGLIGFALGALATYGTDRFGLADPALVRAPEPQGRGLAARAADAHRTYLSDGFRPVELTAAEEPRLLRWIQHHLGANFGIPDLRGMGWLLTGGRIIPGADGPAAFLVYGNGADRFALTVGRAQADGGDAAGADETVRVSTWRDGLLSYVMSTTHDERWLSRNAPAVQDSVRAQTHVISPSP